MSWLVFQFSYMSWIFFLIQQLHVYIFLLLFFFYSAHVLAFFLLFFFFFLSFYSATCLGYFVSYSATCFGIIFFSVQLHVLAICSIELYVLTFSSSFFLLFSIQSWLFFFFYFFYYFFFFFFSAFRTFSDWLCVQVVMLWNTYLSISPDIFDFLK